MNGLISRADAVKEFIKLFGCIQDISDIDEWVDICQTTVCEVPSAEAEWIPCSEGLPDVGERCLVTLSNGVVAIGTLHSAGECEDDFGYIVKWGQRWHLEPASMMIAYPEDSVVAWAPRPKPYRKDGE